jgi:hypothetical protein
MLRRGLIPALVTAVALGVLLGGSADAGNPRASCRLVELGPPGPRGDLLRIFERTNGVVSIDSRRATGEIRIFSNALDRFLACAGGPPTVMSIDRIELRTNSTPFIDALAPGATAEPAGSEIEIVVREDFREPVLNVLGTEAGQTMVVGRLGARRVGVNVNSDSDGARQDADVVLVSGGVGNATVRVNGTSGSDELSLLGGEGFSGPPGVATALLAGGPGNDLLRGGPRGERFNGGDGDDRTLGGRGADAISIGSGRDFVRAGKGPDEIRKSDADDQEPDRVLAGAGNDRVDTYFGGDIIRRGHAPRGGVPGDSVDCGRGRDLALVDSGDRRRACERVFAFPPGSDVDICGFRPCERRLLSGRRG